MIIALFKIITIPIVYCFILLQFFVKWIIVAPVVFCIYAIKYMFIGIIISLIVSMFLTPIVAFILMVIIFFCSIKVIMIDMDNSFWGEWYINWGYANNVFSKNKHDHVIRKRKKYMKIANRKYQKSKDEFMGFDRIADIYAK